MSKEGRQCKIILRFYCLKLELGAKRLQVISLSYSIKSYDNLKFGRKLLKCKKQFLVSLQSVPF